MTGQELSPNDLSTMLSTLCDGTIDAVDFARLQSRLENDPSARRFYLAYLDLHGELCWGNHSREHSAAATDPCPTPSFTTVHAQDATSFGSFGGWAFSYMVAGVVICAMLLGAWAYKISHVQPFAPGIAESNVQPSPIFVGRVTGMKNCRWTDPDTQTVVNAFVPLDREYALASGLLEITYNSGATAILQGPCRYKVDSDAGGYLAKGKLSARINSAKPQAANPESSNSSLIPNPSSLFSVRTPTAVVTDLGTEFGVEVDENGDTVSHVFQGSIKVQGLAASADSGAVLHENESILVSRVRETHQGNKPQDLVRFTHPATTPKFVRRLHKSLEEIDLLDVVADGNGSGHRRERGIDPTTGRFMRTPIERGRDGDNIFRPTYWNRLIDGVFVPVEGQIVQLDSAGNTFDGFSGASGRTFGHIWVRAAEADPNTTFDGVQPWMYSFGRIERFTPGGKGILAMHPNAGMTFDLQAARKSYPGTHPKRFLSVVGLADLSDEALMPEGTVDFRVFIDGRLKLKRLGLTHKSDAERVEVELGPTDRFLTIVATDGGDGITSDWFVLGDPVLKMTPNIKEKKDSMKK